MSQSRFKEYDPLSCLNCDTTFEASTVYCPKCGQKNRKNELSLAEWLTEGISTFFHLEGKTLNTVRDLFVPGKMATNYFNGQRARYVHPFRLLVFSSLICFGLLSFQRYYFPNDEGPRLIHMNFSESNATGIAVGDTNAHKVIKSINLHPISTRMKAIDLLRAKIVYHDRFELIADSMARCGAVRDSAQMALLDTLRNFYPMPESWMGKGHLVTNGDTLDFDARKVAALSPKRIVEESEVEGWFKRLVARKGIHAYQEGSDSVEKLLYGNLSWAVLIYVPFLALGYKLFYRRKLPLYTQHLSYSAILMSIALLLYGFSSLIDIFIPDNIIILAFLLVFIIYNLISDARVFNVSKGHVFLKFSALGFYGFFAFMISLMLWIIITMLII